MKRLTIVAAALALAGCTTSAEQIDKQIAGQQPPSAALRQKIVEAARTELKDPYSVRDATISSYIPAPGKPNTGFVCVRYNAKNGFGGYTGLSTVGTNVINGELRGLFQNPYQCTLASLHWYPLPEAKQLQNL
ncbi:hypothetical protein [Mesorhizobium sp. B263B2A]|uniref:hypothetical protein n=1 Tax=Mesorhizobium sp. B263B2A TaxID=2876669 RepID=UPI001CD15C19|nr:hypothetical protein [Mesorhizobium sp. B263B2A]MCA0033544.1 hypothetical protein [Mesorhizobium sp. B263B2A]